MNSEEKFNKAENTKASESKTEKEFSMSEIDELLKESEKVSVDLDKFSKDEIFKGVHFEDLRTVKDKPDNKFDEVAYAEAGFGKKYNDFLKKFDYFTSFSLNKEKYELARSKDRERFGVLKSKDRVLLDKTKINENIVGKAIEIGQNNKQEKEYIEKNVIDILGDFKEDKSERETFKSFDIDEVDGKIIRYVSSIRTEKGQIEAAGKMRETEISRLETVNGAELVGLKDAMERSAKSKESFLKLGESMSDEEKEKVTSKLDGEESQTKEKIKEKEEKLYEETNKFREPLEGRLKETLEIQNSLTEAFDFIKTGESNLNKQIKECEMRIKEAQKLDLLGNMGVDVLKIFEGQKAELDARTKELAEKKNIISSRLEVLKTNKKEIETALSRVNNIGKTKKEIEQGKKETKDEEKNKETKTETKPTEEKKDDKREEKTWDETRDEVWGLNNTKGKTESQKGGKTFDELFPSHDYPGRKKENAESKTEEEIEVEENEEVAEKNFTKKEIEVITMKELKNLGIMNIKNRTMREQITHNVIMAVEAMIAKSKKPPEEEEAKKEVGDWYRKYSKNYFKKGKQPKL